MSLTRRDCLKMATGSVIGSLFSPLIPTADAAGARPKTVAAIVTEYRYNSHADVILGKILEGWEQDGGPGPALKLASMYLDQFPDEDMSRSVSAKHGVPIFSTIEEAITLGQGKVAVDGVLCIGEHGDYPWNDKEQHLYPRRRFFEGITATFEKHGSVVPVFHDKHLGPVWEDGLWMYERARDLKIPFLAGSSMPVGYRLGDPTPPIGSEIEAAVGIGYSGLDVYGFHALEFYQYHVERRPHAERGVKSVQYLEGEALWQAVDGGAVSKELLKAVFDAVPKQGSPDMRGDKEAALFLFEYADGFKGALFMFQCVEGTAVSLKVKGQPKPIVTAFDERTVPRHPHFAYLLKAIETLVHTGKSPYPVERSLLTGGILDRALTSRTMSGVRLDTPELLISYQPVDYPHAPKPDLLQPVPVGN